MFVPYFSLYQLKATPFHSAAFIWLTKKDLTWQTSHARLFLGYRLMLAAFPARHVVDLPAIFQYDFTFANLVCIWPAYPA